MQMLNGLQIDNEKNKQTNKQTIGSQRLEPNEYTHEIRTPIEILRIFSITRNQPRKKGQFRLTESPDTAEKNTTREIIYHI